MTASAETGLPDRADIVDLLRERLAFTSGEFGARVGRSQKHISKLLREAKIPHVYVGDERMVPAAYARAVFAGEQFIEPEDTP